jgi:hypothetical protein
MSPTNENLSSHVKSVIDSAEEVILNSRQAIERSKKFIEERMKPSPNQELIDKIRADENRRDYMNTLRTMKNQVQDLGLTKRSVWNQHKTEWDGFGNKLTLFTPSFKLQTTFVVEFDPLNERKITTSLNRKSKVLYLPANSVWWEGSKCIEYYTVFASPIIREMAKHAIIVAHDNVYKIPLTVLTTSVQDKEITNFKRKIILTLDCIKAFRITPI